MSGRTVLPVGKVFVPGGQPTVTYNPRASLKLEQTVRDYLDERGKVLSLSGPTKSGKTVLLKSILNDRNLVWLSGGQLEQRESFWEQVADALGVHSEVGESTAHEEGTTNSGQIGGTIKPMGVGIEAKKSNSGSKSVTSTATVGRKRSVIRAASEALMSNDAVLVIDDFHYLTTDVQLHVIRNLKELVFQGLPVILAAVPHRAYDAVRAEKEMTGRVDLLEIPFWSDEELLGIAAGRVRGAERDRPSGPGQRARVGSIQQSASHADVLPLAL